jgi:hypothetical protein
MKYYKPPLLVLIVFSVSIALADDMRTTNGKLYKNATVTRVEPDGIIVKFSGGLVKIPFTELSEELRQEYHYNPQEAQKFAADTAARINATNAIANAKQEHQDAEKLLQQVMIFAIIKPYIYGKERTTAHIQEYADHGHSFYDHDWRKVGGEFTGVIDEPMPQYYESGDTLPVALYKIGHTDDSSRDPLFTTNKNKAMQLLTPRSE